MGSTVKQQESKEQGIDHSFWQARQPGQNAQYIFGVICLLILGLIPFHGFISVWGGHLFGYSLIWKSWKEALLAILALLTAYLLIKRPVLRQIVFRSLVNRLVIGLIAVHIISAAIFQPQLKVLLAGLAIDLRFLAFFLAMQLAVLMWPNIKKHALKIVALDGLVVIIFGCFQVFLLPPDFLSFFGYSKDTIMPYLTVDGNPLFVRINSTLRGPNPLGAYLIITGSLLAAWLFVKKKEINLSLKTIFVLAGSGVLVVLYATHSRSAWVGFLIAVLCVTAISFYYLIKKDWRIWAGSVGILALIGIGYYVVQDTYLYQNLIEHKDPQGQVGIDSNEEHFRSLAVGFEKMISQPLGEGPGSTGSASLYGESPNIIENQYLFVAHEAGWLGLGLFITICGLIGFEFYKRATKDWMSAGLLASLIGISAVGLLQPVWVDDTVALIWWGLAGLAIIKRELNKNE